MAEMLRVVGVDSLDELIDETVPEDIRQTTPLDFGRPLSERGISIGCGRQPPRTAC